MSALELNNATVSRLISPSFKAPAALDGSSTGVGYDPFIAAPLGCVGTSNYTFSTLGNVSITTALTDVSNSVPVFTQLFRPSTAYKRFRVEIILTCVGVVAGDVLTGGFQVGSGSGLAPPSSWISGAAQSGPNVAASMYSMAVSSLVSAANGAVFQMADTFSLPDTWTTSPALQGIGAKVSLACSTARSMKISATMTIIPVLPA